MKKHNFYAGPSILPQYTIDNAIEGIKNFAGSGLSVLEISHRSKEFVACINDTIALFSRNCWKYLQDIMFYFLAVVPAYSSQWSR